MKENYRPPIEDINTTPKRRIKSALAEVLRVKDIITREAPFPINLTPRDIPDDFKGRNLVDIGSGGGYRWNQINNLFKPSSYIGIDREPKEVEAGMRRNLDIRQLDYLQDDLKGDLGVIFGASSHLQAVQKFEGDFKSLVFDRHARDVKAAQALIEEYKAGLKGKLVKSLIRWNRTGGKMVYFFYDNSELIEKNKVAN